MENTKLELSLKTYLDEKFQEINCKLTKLELARQTEHDVVVSACKDISFQQDEIRSIKLNAIECKDHCNRRKSDLEPTVIAIVDPRIKAANGKLKMWLIGSVGFFLLTVTAYVVSNFVMAPVQKIIQPQTVQEKK